MIALFATTNPLGPTPLGCAVLLALMAAPIVLILVALRSVLGAAPLAWWQIALLVVGTPVLVYHVRAIPFVQARGPMLLWVVSGWVAVALTPAALLRDVGKGYTARVARPD